MNTSPGKNSEIIKLSEEICKDIESSQLSLSSIVTKCLRLARLLNDFDSIKWFSLELSGYNSKNEEYVPQDEWVLALRSNRNTKKREWVVDKFVVSDEELITVQSIGQLEASIMASRQQLSVCQDPDINFHPVNAYQLIPQGNKLERSTLANNIAQNTAILDKIKIAVYNFVLNIYYQYNFGDITQGLFESYKSKVDEFILKHTPDLAKEFKSMQDNVLSKNEKDWSNVGVNCRKLLKLLADTYYPAKPEVREIIEDGKSVGVTDPEYKNRLMTFIKSKSQSDSFKKIIGSQLNLIGDRIDSIDESGSKGTHESFDLQEAKRLIIIIYILVGDILSLVDETDIKETSPSFSFSPSPSVEPIDIDDTSLIQNSPQP